VFLSVCSSTVTACLSGAGFPAGRRIDARGHQRRDRADHQQAAAGQRRETPMSAPITQHQPDTHNHSDESGDWSDEEEGEEAARAFEVGHAEIAGNRQGDESAAPARIASR
jgi:hypothetical protein